MKRERLLVAVAAVVALSVAGPAYSGGDATAGQAKAKGCAGCHGADGKGKKDNPPLAGMPEADFVKALHDYKSGARAHKLMNGLTKRLSEKDIANLAAYYASLN